MSKKLFRYIGFEDFINLTMQTLKKIMQQLPNVKRAVAIF